MRGFHVAAAPEGVERRSRRALLPRRLRQPNQQPQRQDIQLRAPKHCGRNGCRVIVPNGQRCDEHKHGWGKGDPRTKTKAHRDRRQRVLARDNYQCQLRYPNICIGTATVADHKIALGLGGADTDDAMQAACQPCHNRKSSAEGHTAQGHQPNPEQQGVGKAPIGGHAPTVGAADSAACIAQRGKI